MTAWEALIMLLKLLFAFSLFYVLLPLQTIQLDSEPNESRFLDKLFISLIHSNLFFILLVHLLAVAKIYETISLGLVSILFFVYLMRKKALSGSHSFQLKFVLRLFDFSEMRLGLKAELLTIKNNLIQNIKAWLVRLRDGFLKRPITWTILVITLLVGGFTSSYHAFTHLYFAASDPYVHLVWSKQLGENLFYVNGVYPYGFEAIISALNKLSFIDSYYIVRFLGPITGILIILSILFVVGKKVAYDHIFIIIAAILYVSGFNFAESQWRQLSALSMEYAVIFFLPGLYFLNNYFETGSKKKLLLAVECLMIIAFVHLYIIFCLVACYILLSLVNIKRIMQWGNLFYYILMMIAAGFIGVLPLIIGLLMGVKFHAASSGFVSENIKLLDFTQFIHNWYKFRESNPILLVFLICAVLWFILIFFKRGKKNDIGFIMIAIFMYGMYRTEELKLPSLIPAYRIAVVLTPMIIIVIVVPLYLLASSFKTKDYITFKIAKSVIGALLIGVILYLWPISIPKVTDVYQYDTAVKAYLQIKANLPYLNWTIVSPAEEYQLAYTYGQHKELLEFVGEISDPSGKKLKIDTDYIFFYTEKIPIGTNIPITEADAQKPFPAPKGNLTDQYYTNKENRRIIEAKTYYWAENYMKTHSNMDIYMDTPTMRIYKLSQPVNHSENLLK